MTAEIRFDGQRYGFWQKVDIRESVDDLCASVRLSITRPGTRDSLGLTANTVAGVLIGGDLVTTIRPDSVRRRVDADSHAIHVEARSLGRELVDCQYSTTLHGLRLGEIVKRICGIFKVPVKIAAETAVVPDFSMQCEIPANALINAARAANLLLYPLPDGGLILTQPTSAAPVATLEYGVHIKRYEVVDEFKLRFSEYVVKGFDYDGGQATKGASKDAGISFFRPMHIVADKHGHTLGGCGRRALLERNRRMARAHRIDLEVVGWRYLDGNGKLQPWAINTQVRVIIPKEGIDGVFLIGERAFTEDDKVGSVAHLQVMNRDAFMGEEKKKSKRGTGTRKVMK
ncbi:tail protein [Sulfurimicrobium lacus]|uniref:Tail protein n=1 Tax=Sulfurimicrobium lacus TaxID=2715678 RepID=A0A6F8VFD9_9PROT|nr:phage tail protein [Sulfurimicrobium lacus]BCB28438.1 tail protein [Sulfurimicrobium lacus]